MVTEFLSFVVVTLWWLLFVGRSRRSCVSTSALSTRMLAFEIRYCNLQYFRVRCVMILGLTLLCPQELFRRVSLFVGRYRKACVLGSPLSARIVTFQMTPVFYITKCLLVVFP